MGEDFYHSTYTYSAEFTVAATISYSCENCGNSDSYKIWRTFSSSVGPVAVYDYAACQRAESKVEWTVKCTVASIMRNPRTILLEELHASGAEVKRYGDIARRCPKCGYIQSWMSQAARRNRDMTMGSMGWTVGFLIAVIAFMLLREALSLLYSAIAAISVGALFFGVFKIIMHFVPINSRKKFGTVTTTNEPIVWCEEGSPPVD